MKRKLATLGLIVGWMVLVVAVVGARAYWFAAPDVQRGDLRSIEAHLVARLADAVAAERIGAGALVLLAEGEIVAEHGFGMVDAVTRRRVEPEDTLFQVASVSKAVAAWGVMRLVEEGRLALDEPVAPRLRRWRLAGKEPWTRRVTVRHLLSHTAGLDDGFGYGGFGPGEPVQTLEESLTMTRDSTVGAARGVRVAREPGTAMAYSGAGYAILQLLVEGVAGRPFEEYMQEAVLEPLGMTRSSFDLDVVVRNGWAGSLAPAFDHELQVQPHRRYTAKAAVSLLATPRDVARFAQALLRQNPVLRRETVERMLEPQPGTEGSWGLGLTLFTTDHAGGRVVGHSGGTYPAWGAMTRVNPASGNGMVLMVSGGRGALDRLPHDWVYWETGVILAEARRELLYDQAPGGLAAITLGAVAIAVLRSRGSSRRRGTRG